MTLDRWFQEIVLTDLCIAAAEPVDLSVRQLMQQLETATVEYDTVTWSISH